MSQSPLRTARERPAQAVRVPLQRQRSADPVDASSRARRALLLPAMLCGVATVAGAATLGAVAVNQSRHTTHDLRLVSRSGALVADTADPDSTVDTADLGRLRASFEQQYGARLDDLVTARFRNTTPGQGHPAGTVVFVGATIDTAGDPADFVDEIRRAATSEGSRAQQVDAGRDARGACVSTRAGASTCAWSTGDSVGQLIATGTGWSVAELSQAMRTLRADAETQR